MFEVNLLALNSCYGAVSSTWKASRELSTDADARSCCLYFVSYYSCVVFKGAAYTELWHGIPTSTAASSGVNAEASSGSCRRISFTVRHVLNVIPVDKQIVNGEAQWEQSRRAAFFQKSVTDA
jgi:hypothetical protein